MSALGRTPTSSRRAERRLFAATNPKGHPLQLSAQPKSATSSLVSKLSVEALVGMHELFQDLYQAAELTALEIQEP